MAKTKLTQAHKEYIEEFAYDLLKQMVTKETKIDLIEDKKNKVLQKILDREFPMKDMEILAKYNCATRHEWIYISAAGLGGYCHMEFGAKKLLPIDRPSIQPEGNDLKVIQQWHKENEAFKTLLQKRMTDYKAIIAASKTFEELVDLFPAADAVRDVIAKQSTAVVAVSDEVRARIWNDQKTMVNLLKKQEKAA